MIIMYCIANFSIIKNIPLYFHGLIILPSGGYPPFVESLVEEILALSKCKILKMLAVLLVPLP